MNELTSTIAPCLWFDGRAEEAADFYVGVFADAPGGSKLLTRTYYPDDEHGQRGQVMTAEIVIQGLHVTLLNGGPQFTFSEAISFQVPCRDQAEVDRYWAALTDGGEEGPCGWCKDRFGLSWQVVPTAFYAMMSGEADPAGVEAAMQAMYGMKKLVLADLQRAYDEAAR
ncbi:putative 3-demethylubiquinone-9 3-methyltransferase (glyoxalase superfamily) [Friedmanniella endophytica]|uniref:Putative 3-demethylubiquinone-9 3-methyltransferase (Glyoxalase superfamily) n=1 Tax=Microlunatus kandeliicorticis TaxID=1759536 RepID=A0A7W3P5F7_9ACTN|nr:VOC family protein [Microlunatus kandeliicorticis]MBA8793815.1 putative 3-demethylubiquinone-9 3-methyltransferase (glyoxalase superfamily) [Microlunatus kandeliicorticis]